MSIKTQRICICNCCGTKTESDTLPYQWFSTNINGKNNTKIDVCKECGHKLHVALSECGVKHQFVCHEYSRDDGPGAIIIEGFQNTISSIQRNSSYGYSENNCDSFVVLCLTSR